MPQALGHAEGELPDPPTGHRREADLIEDLVHPAAGDVVGECEPAQVVAGGAGRMERLGVEQGTHLAVAASPTRRSASH